MCKNTKQHWLLVWTLGSRCGFCYSDGVSGILFPISNKRYLWFVSNINKILLLLFIFESCECDCRIGGFQFKMFMKVNLQRKKRVKGR